MQAGIGVWVILNHYRSLVIRLLWRETPVTPRYLNSALRKLLTVLVPQRQRFGLDSHFEGL